MNRIQYSLVFAFGEESVWNRFEIALNEIRSWFSSQVIGGLFFKSEVISFRQVHKPIWSAATIITSSINETLRIPFPESAACELSFRLEAGDSIGKPTS